MASKNSTANDPEISAISLVYSALKDLNADSQQRVIDYVSAKLSLSSRPPAWPSSQDFATTSVNEEVTSSTKPTVEAVVTDSDDDLEGISPVAIKWMRRNDLSSATLSSIFSLGIDDIDLVAKKVPGDTKIKRVRSVFLLQGIAAYLSTGAARMTHERVKEACLHYDAYDSTNFARDVRSLSAEVSGTKESGYVLTSRGLAAATETIKEMTANKD